MLPPLSSLSRTGKSTSPPRHPSSLTPTCFLFRGKAKLLPLFCILFPLSSPLLCSLYLSILPNPCRSPSILQIILAMFRRLPFLSGLNSSRCLCIFPCLCIHSRNLPLNHTMEPVSASPQHLPEPSITSYLFPIPSWVALSHTLPRAAVIAPPA